MRLRYAVGALVIGAACARLPKGVPISEPPMVAVQQTYKSELHQLVLRVKRACTNKNSLLREYSAISMAVANMYDVAPGAQNENGILAQALRYLKENDRVNVRQLIIALLPRLQFGESFSGERNDPEIRRFQQVLTALAAKDEMAIEYIRQNWIGFVPRSKEEQYKREQEVLLFLSSSCSK